MGKPPKCRRKSVHIGKPTPLRHHRNIGQRVSQQFHGVDHSRPGLVDIHQMMMQGFAPAHIERCVGIANGIRPWQHCWWQFQMPTV